MGLFNFRRTIIINIQISAQSHVILQTSAYCIPYFVAYSSHQIQFYQPWLEEQHQFQKQTAAYFSTVSAATAAQFQQQQQHNFSSNISSNSDKISAASSKNYQP
ncbi:unnamed protein product [Rhodiola kirilowii]